MSRIKTLEVSFQPELTERRSRRAGSFRWWLGVSSCALEAMPRSCACSCSVLAEARRKVNIHASHISHLSHTTRPPAPSKTLAQHPLALGRSSPWVGGSAEPLRPSVRTTLRQEPARICTLRRSLRHTQQKMRSRRTEPAAQYQPRPAASAPPHPRSCLLMGKDLWLGGWRQRPPCVTRRPARSWR